MNTHRRLPTVFVGHGSPMNAIEDNPWSRGFRQLGRQLPPPRAILAVSAHWLTDGTAVTAGPRPRTIHDFGGFPKALFEVEYPAPGSPALAARVGELLGAGRVTPSTHWGLDHGSWSVLRWMYPDATLPVVQLSLDYRLAPRQHLELAAALRPLRDEGVLILGSGNITHNLRDALSRRQGGTPEWAARFDAEVERVLRERDGDTLLDMAFSTANGRIAHPSPEHWLPLIYAYGASDDHDRVHFPIDGFDWGSISMRSVQFQ